MGLESQVRSRHLYQSSEVTTGFLVRKGGRHPADTTVGGLGTCVVGRPMFPERGVIDNRGGPSINRTSLSLCLFLAVNGFRCVEWSSSRQDVGYEKATKTYRNDSGTGTSSLLGLEGPCISGVTRCDEGVCSCGCVRVRVRWRENERYRPRRVCPVRRGYSDSQRVERTKKVGGSSYFYTDGRGLTLCSQGLGSGPWSTRLT